MFAFVLSLFLVRIMGRKLISQMTFFDFVVGVALGSTVAALAIGPNNTAYNAVTVLVVFTLLAVITGVLHLRSQGFRKLIESEPVTMIANGQIVEGNLAKTRLSLNDLLMLLREKNVFNIGDVEFALLENDGKLSVLPKSQKQPVTPSDLNLATGYKGLTRDLILDGEVMVENLKDAGLDESWLTSRLQAQGTGGVKEVFYAGLDTAGNLYVSLKKSEKESHGKYGLE
jgi:uncharacterized membrane protein YcaP (DUF421 family)